MTNSERLLKLLCDPRTKRELRRLGNPFLSDDIRRVVSRQFPSEYARLEASWQVTLASVVGLDRDGNPRQRLSPVRRQHFRNDYVLLETPSPAPSPVPATKIPVVIQGGPMHGERGDLSLSYDDEEGWVVLEWPGPDASSCVRVHHDALVSALERMRGQR